MQISQRPIKQSTPESSPEKSNGQGKSKESSNDCSDYTDLETAFLANIGNWKKLRRQDNKDIYKCNECDCKLEVEKKGHNFRVKQRLNASDEAHHWFDKAHLSPFSGKENQEEGADFSPADRLHSSVEAFIKL